MIKMKNLLKRKRKRKKIHHLMIPMMNNISGGVL
jgi:hypothetical protein